VGARIPKNCGPLDRAVDIYIDEYVQIMIINHSLPTMVSSLPKPIFTYTPHGHGGEVLK